MNRKVINLSVLTIRLWKLEFFAGRDSLMGGFDEVAYGSEPFPKGRIEILTKDHGRLNLSRLSAAR